MAPSTNGSDSNGRIGQTQISPVTWAVFFGAWALYHSLRSWNFSGVDGPFRALEALRSEKIFFHGNNHMLYPVWFHLWGKLLGLLGLRPTDPVELMRSAQALNAMLGAGILAGLHHLFRQMASSTKALLGTAAVGLSYCFLKHATNSAEVIPGIFFGVLGLIWMVRGIRRDAVLPLIVSGCWLALALASYQSMGQLALIGVVLCCNVSSSASQGRPSLMAMVGRLFWVGVGGILGICVVYGWAFHMQDIPVAKMVPKFFKMADGSEDFFGFKSSRFLHLAIGYLSGWYNLFPPDSTGIRETLRRPDAALWLCWIGLGALLVARIVMGVCRDWLLDFRDRRLIWRVTTATAGIGLLLPLLCWDPYYDKLLILPLMGSVAIALAVLRAGDSQNKRQWKWAWAAAGLLLLEIGSLAGSTLWNMRNPNTYLEDAKRVASLARPEDWMILEFDPVSQYFTAIFLNDWNRTVAMPMLKKDQAKKWLANAKEKSRQGSGRLLFLGVLEMDRENWNAFIGRTGGMEYDELNLERASAKELASFRNGRQRILLYEVPVSSLPPAP